MMERLTAKIERIATARTDERRAFLADRIAELLPPDIAVDMEGDAIVLAGKRLGIRSIVDPAFAFVRDGVGSLR